jgi:ribosomal protein S20
MKSIGKTSALILLGITVSGCRHQTKTTPPPAAQAAPIAPATTYAKNGTSQPPPPSLPTPELPKIGPPAPAPAKEQNTREVATNNPPTDASPIGPLSEPGSSITSPRRNQILDEINSTEKGLNDIKRPLSTDEQTTATQVRTFISKAKDALNQEDLDGARTLVTKAKVLLDELTKQ